MDDTDDSRLLREAIRNIPRLAAIDDAAPGQVAAAGRVLELEAGESLPLSGDVLDAMLVILSGCVAGKDGRGREFAVGAGGVLGRRALYDDLPVTGPLCVARTTRVWMLTREDFAALLLRVPATLTALMQQVADGEPPLSEELACGHAAGDRDVMPALRSCAWFAQCDEAALGALSARARHCRLRAGEVLFRHGDPPTGMYLILDGALQVRIRDRGGHYVDVATLGAGEPVGEMALIDDAPRSADVVAVESVELLEIDRAAFLGMLGRSPQLVRAMLAGMSAMLRRSNTGLAGDPAAVPLPVHLALVDQAERDRLRKAGRGLELAAGQWVFRQGDPATAMYVVDSGTVAILLEGRDDTGQRELARLGPDQLFGEMAMIDGSPRSASARALDDARLIAIEREDFIDLLGRTPPLLQRLLASLSEKVRAANRADSRIRARL